MIVNINETIITANKPTPSPKGVVGDVVTEGATGVTLGIEGSVGFFVEAGGVALHV